MNTEEEARKIMSGGLGKAELEFATSLTAPLFWVIREENKQFRARNGSAFFLDAGEGPFGITAAHVIEGLQEDRASLDVVACQLGHDLVIDIDARLIDIHAEIDIATFTISGDEIASIGKTSLTGHNKDWPPDPPDEDKGIYFSGFPGVERQWVGPNEIIFGVASSGGSASSISELDISSLVERQNLIDVMDKGLPPEDYDFGGMSGGPMLTVVEEKGVRSWRLAGVIYHGPNPPGGDSEAIAGLEIFKARRADFILPNGRLDKARWNELNRR